MKNWKKNLITAAILVTVCSGIYLNWVYTGGENTKNLEDTLDAEKVMSDDLLYLGDESVEWPADGIKLLKDMGFKTAAMALSDDSVTIKDPQLLAEDKLAIILGTEGDGLSASTIADCDYTVRIPMSHGVDSLNVAAASAVAFWQLGSTD